MAFTIGGSSMNDTFRIWAPRLLLAAELALFAYVAGHSDVGLKTGLVDGQPVGTCSEQEFATVGMAWLGMTCLAFAGCLLSLFGRSKWLGLLLFALPVITATTLAKYQEDRFPACWERPADPNKS
jgi:hypothetical protein